MSGDRTQHVLDAIDGALDDWSVSGDAMRWSPEPKPRPQATLVMPTGLRVIPAPDWRPPPLPDVEALGSAFFRYLASSYADALNRMVIPMREFGQAVRAASDTLAPVLERIREEPEPDLPPDRTDVRAHALWRAQHRHTGPQRPTAGQSKRPRRA